MEIVGSKNAIAGEMLTPFKLPKIKSCGCGVQYTHTRGRDLLCHGGCVWFDCTCGSTLMLRLDDENAA